MLFALESYTDPLLMGHGTSNYGQPTDLNQYCIILGQKYIRILICTQKNKLMHSFELVEI